MRVLADAPAVNSKLQYIDSLRAIAILMVIVTHADKFITGLQRPVLTLADFGQMGVQMFFIVSAFTLCLTFDKSNGEEKGLTKFYIRRYFRIAPLYYFGIFLYFLYFSFAEPLLNGEQPAFASRYTFTNIMANLLMVNDFVPGSANNKIVPGGWSIGTETTFYALFPLIFMLYKKVAHHQWALVVIPIAGLALCYALVQLAMLVTGLSVKNNSLLYFNIICQLPVFLFGISLYFRLKNWEAKKVKPVFYLAAFAVSLALALAIFIKFQQMAFLIPISAGFCFLFLFMLFKSLPQLNSSFLSRIGQLSYSIYLFHFIFAWAGSKLLDSYLSGVVLPEILFVISIVLTTSLSFLLATLSEKFIEQPGIALGKLLIDKLKAKKAKQYETAAATLIINSEVQRGLGIN